MGARVVVMDPGLHRGCWDSPHSTGNYGSNLVLNTPLLVASGLVTTLWCILGLRMTAFSEICVEVPVD